MVPGHIDCVSYSDMMDGMDSSKGLHPEDLGGRGGEHGGEHEVDQGDAVGDGEGGEGHNDGGREPAIRDALLLLAGSGHAESVAHQQVHHDAPGQSDENECSAHPHDPSLVDSVGALVHLPPGGAKDANGNLQKCSYVDCCTPPDDLTLPGKSKPKYIRIHGGSRAGARDWGPLVGSTLCNACYYYYKKKGTLIRAQGPRKKDPLKEEQRRCTYLECANPTLGKYFLQIEEGKKAGNKDWASLVGQVLCEACYNQFIKKGTLERPSNQKRTKSRIPVENRYR